MRLPSILVPGSIVVSFSALALLGACGGKVTFVEDGGSEGGAGSSSSKSTTTKSATTSVNTAASTGGGSCTDLLAALNAANAAAQECDPAISSPQCNGFAVLNDTCGCPSILANEKAPEKVKAAQLAYDAWINAGCGPFECGGGCFKAVGGFCSPTNGNKGMCFQALPD